MTPPNQEEPTNGGCLLISERQIAIRLLGQASIGAMFGALLALLIVKLGINHHPVTPSQELLPWVMPNVLPKPREKAFYLLTLLLGFVFARVAVKRLWSVPLTLLLATLLLSVPFFNALADQVFTHNISYLYLALSAALLLSVWCAIKKTVLPTTLLQNHLIPAASEFSWKHYSILLLLISCLILPSSVESIAAQIGMEMHVASFMIGPALYFLHPNLLPGIDYFTQYSLGMGYVFSFLLGHSAEQTMVRYVWFVLAVLWLFYAQMAYVLLRLYRSWWVAAIVTLLSLVLLFHTSRHFFDPSSSVLRYPLLGVSALLVSRWIVMPQSYLRTVLLAASLALSVFFNTETGIIFIVSTFIATAIVPNKPLAFFRSFITLMLLTGMMLVLLLLSVYGNGILSLNFVAGIIKPLLIYGQIGFGGWLINWSLHDLNWFYNLVVPGMTLATLAIVSRIKTSHENELQRLSMLVFMATAGLLMMAKFINMSIIAVWQMNALGLFVAMGWWLDVFINHRESVRIELFSRTMMLQTNKALTMLVVLSAAYLACCSNDARNVERYGMRSWLKYPALVTSPLQHLPACHRMSCVPNVPAAADVKLIQDRTQRGEQVAIIDLYDWTYLLSAKRAPLMSFLPSIDIFTQHQLAITLAKLQHAQYLFVPKDGNHHPNIDGALQPFILPTLNKQYVYDGEGERLIALRKRDSSTRPSA